MNDLESRLIVGKISYKEMRMCVGKIPYADKIDANKAKKRMQNVKIRKNITKNKNFSQQKPNSEWSAYKCKYCEFWHIGHISHPPYLAVPTKKVFKTKEDFENG